MTGALPLPAATDPVTRDPRLWRAACDFEAMTVSQLLAPMFDAADVAHSAFGGGDAEAAWQPMLMEALGKKIEAQGGFGLAAPVYTAMLRAQEGAAGRLRPGSGDAVK